MEQMTQVSQPVSLNSRVSRIENTTRTEFSILSKLTQYEVIVIALTVIAIVVFIFQIISVQMTTYNLNTAINTYQQDAMQLNNQTNIKINQIAEQFDYDVIQHIAAQEGMTLNSNRVIKIEGQDEE